MASGKRPVSTHSDTEPASAEPASPAGEINAQAAGSEGAAGDTPMADISAAERSAAEPPLPPSPTSHDVPLAARRGRVLPALTAGIGGGLAVLLGMGGLWTAGLIPNRDDGVTPVAARLAAVELQIRDLAAAPPAAADAARRNNAELSARLAQLEASRPAADPQLASRVAATEATAKSAADGITALARRVEEVATVAAEARSRADTAAAQPSAATGPAVEANKGEIDALRSRLAAVESAGKPQVDKKDLDALAARIGATEQTIAALDQSTKTLQAGQAAARARDRSMHLATVASALNDAVSRGEPYAAELNYAKPLAPPNVLAALEPFAASGLPSSAVLARELSDLVPSLQPKSDSGASEGGILEKLQANAARLVRIRPVAEQPGDDARSVVARIELKAAQSDIAGALAELGKLPPDQRAPAAPWMQKATARQAAVDASRRLAADSYAALATLPQ